MKILLKGIENGIYLRHIREFAKAFPEHPLIDEGDASAEIIVTESLSAAEIDGYPDLKAVFAPIVGKNRFDIKYLQDKGIESFFIEGTPNIVAEHAMALALALTGKIIPHDRNMKSEDSWSFKGSNWYSICGCNVTILGMGRIGDALTAYLKPFGCHITGFRRHLEKRTGGAYDHVTNNLHEALKDADLVFVALELNTETFNMIGRNEIDLMKGAYLINIARAAIIEEEALAYGVDEGILLGYASDPWYYYPKGYPEGISDPDDRCPPSKYDFYKRDNVICVPHTGTETNKAMEAYIMQTLKQLKQYLCREQ